ncbi:2-phospho-L-lactate guanylyltransferase [Streptomyces sp. NPDC005438]|uniref:2-phospho-L-lactate guanylyltransferase n=1 Tax=Streptomyces sp. NPDC005438 TaxID=3156880 RepID=UPI0033BA089A
MGQRSARGTAGGWSVVVPVKPLEQAKSRLASGLPEELRPRLALAFAQDTVSAALSAPSVRTVAVVTNDTEVAAELSLLGARIVPDLPRSGLNGALRYAADVLRDTSADIPLAAVNADLPALRGEELERVLERASRFSRAFLADQEGSGTTLLTALGGTELNPLFGPASRRRHRRSGAVEIPLPDVPSVRQDVDTERDLRAAQRLGLGRFTSTQVRVPCGPASGPGVRPDAGRRGRRRRP